MSRAVKAVGFAAAADAITAAIGGGELPDDLAAAGRR